MEHVLGLCVTMEKLAELFTPQALPREVQTELREESGAAVLFLLQQAVDVRDDDAALQRYADAAYDRAWERLHCGSWKSVHPVWRVAFGYASVFKAAYLVRQERWKECLEALDMCLMMAGPHAVPDVHEKIAAVGQVMMATSIATEEEAHERGAAKRRRVMVFESDALPALRFPIARVCLPSLVEFRKTYMETSTPVIITGGMKDWPAMGNVDPARSWQSLEYFRRVAGERTVPIEVGSSYLEDDWGQQLMTMNEFIDRFLQPTKQHEPKAVGYLAQHHLFEQIPALGRDIMTPDYCALPRSEEEDAEDDDVTVNAWFGPKNTISPLHFDPKDNLLCQVVGKKYLRLYAPSQSDKLYPTEGLLSNTSLVDVEAPDLTQFPNFAQAEYVECVLAEGEMLYIPPRYWHFVRSLSTSFSVSFWWA